jgi:enoyl-CoA hydratase/carnithine racemase
MESGEMSGRIFETLTEDLAAVRVPTICALNGSAYGGGTEIALCCDFRIGVSGSRMSVPAARLGICYPASGLRRFVEALGLSTSPTSGCWWATTR